MEPEFERGTVSVCVLGDLRLYGRGEREHELLAAFQDVLSARAVDLDLRGITHLDSSGVAALARFTIDCRRLHLPLAVALPEGVSGDTLRMLRVFAGTRRYGGGTTSSTLRPALRTLQVVAAATGATQTGN